MGSDSDILQATNTISGQITSFKSSRLNTHSVLFWILTAAFHKASWNSRILQVANETCGAQMSPLRHHSRKMIGSLFFSHVLPFSNSAVIICFPSGTVRSCSSWQENRKAGVKKSAWKSGLFSVKNCADFAENRVLFAAEIISINCGQLFMTFTSGKCAVRADFSRKFGFFRGSKLHSTT